MSETIEREEIVKRYQNLQLSGRFNIYTNLQALTAENVIAEVTNSLSRHNLNMLAIEYLYWYRRGLQPILDKEKEVRPEINHIIVENHADEIVAFKNGYFLTQPAFYISRDKSEEVTEKVKKLNEYLYLSGKLQADNKVVDWFHTCGTGVCYIQAVDDPDAPVRAYSLDPRAAYVVYDLTPAHNPVYAVNMVSAGDEKTVLFDVYTKDTVFRLAGGYTGEITTIMPNDTMAVPTDIISIMPNPIGAVPMVEYHYNSVNMGAFESVITLLDGINEVMSNRIDGVDQFIQSLAVAVNCQFEDGTTANDIRQAGMIVLKSIGENKADFKILSEQLNQTETQVLVDYLYQQVLTICGMPSTTKGGTSTSDTGAAVLYRDGWYQADTVARNTEDLFKEANRRFDEIFISILNKKTDLGIKLQDFELQFVRNETANLLVKTQGALNLKELGLSPEIALAKSGVSNDPVADVNNSKDYIKAKWGINDNTEDIVESKVDTYEM